MRMTASVLSFLLSINTAQAQTDNDIAKSGVPIKMLFPQGKTNTLILSYDDGRTEDRQLVKKFRFIRQIILL